MSNPEVLNNHEERGEHLDLYVMFPSESERDRAASIFRQLMEDDKTKGLYVPPAGPDYPMALPELPKNSLNGDFEKITGDSQRPGIGLKLSFRHTPQGFAKPEDFLGFLLILLEEKGLKIKKTGGHLETYEVVGNRQKGNVF